MAKETIASLTARVEALEAALEGARTAFRELRAKTQPTRVEHRVHSSPRLSIGEWNAALNDLRAERGLHATAFVPRSDVLARAAEMRQSYEDVQADALPN